MQKKLLVKKVIREIQGKTQPKLQTLESNNIFVENDAGTV